MGQLKINFMEYSLHWSATWFQKHELNRRFSSLNMALNANLYTATKINKSKDIYLGHQTEEFKRFEIYREKETTKYATS